MRLFKKKYFSYFVPFLVMLLFAFLEAIQRTPAIFEDIFLGLQLGTTPLIGIKSGNYWYIILIVLIIFSPLFYISTFLLF